MWGRLSLRWQVAIAVLLPSLAVAAFTSAYFPDRQREFGLERLRSQAQVVAALAADQAAMIVQERQAGQPSWGDVGGQSALLARLFDRVEQGEEVAFQALLGPEGRVVYARGDLPREVVPTEKEGCALLEELRQPTVRCSLPGGYTYALGLGDRQLQEEMVAFRRPTVLVYASALVFALICAFLLGRLITDPILRIIDAARQVARGDVSMRSVEVVGAGEVRLLAEAFNDMLGTLQGTVSELLNRIEQLASASKGLAGASSDQDHVIAQQAAYAQQIAATFEELSRTAEQISGSTEVVESSARRTHEAVAEAMAVMAQMVDGINDIRGGATGVTESILGLNQDLQQVAKIAQVINQVAERSDLLALNAALEGTKAGEVGRGFSLVAAEMRRLAENVQASAKDIARIVEKVLDSGNEAATRARQGMAISDRGVEVAQQASTVFQRIVELARGTSEAAKQITVATRQQRQSSEQAVLGARNVADLVKQGVDATSRTNHIAQDLRSLAEGLTALTGRFRVSRS